MFGLCFGMHYIVSFFVFSGPECRSTSICFSCICIATISTWNIQQSALS